MECGEGRRDPGAEPISEWSLLNGSHRIPEPFVATTPIDARRGRERHAAPDDASDRTFTGEALGKLERVFEDEVRHDGDDESAGGPGMSRPTRSRCRTDTVKGLVLGAVALICAIVAEAFDAPMMRNIAEARPATVREIAAASETRMRRIVPSEAGDVRLLTLDARRGAPTPGDLEGYRWFAGAKFRYRLGTCCFLYEVATPPGNADLVLSVECATEV